MDTSRDIFHVAVEFSDGTRSEWESKSTGAKEEHFEAWYFDGTKRVPSTLTILRTLPHEACGTKEGYFMKADSQLISWKRRYFVVSGGYVSLLRFGCDRCLTIVAA
jgi:hypothetical protein